MNPQLPITEYLYAKASRSRFPVSGTFELSPVCNFACKMCYVRKTRSQVLAHDRPMMTLEKWLKVAQEARDAGMLYLLLTGGEPFLWPDFWPLYEALSTMGLLISINSNGSLIDDAAIARLKKNPPDRINITLYGGSDAAYEALCGVKGVFHQVDRAIRGLKEAGIVVKLNCSLTPDNAADQAAIVQYAKDHDLLLTMTEYMFPPLRRDPSMVGKNQRFTPEEAALYHLRGMKLQMEPDAYTESLRRISAGTAEPLGLDESCVDPRDGKIRCRAGSASFWITWDGWMTPCGMLPEPKTELAGRSFGEAWEDLGEISRRLALSGICPKCESRNLCHACAAMATAETGSASGVPQYLCRMVQAMQRIARQELANHV